MAIQFTGTDTTGFDTTITGDTWVTRDGEVVSNSGGVVFDVQHSNTTYVLGGLMVTDNYFGVDFNANGSGRVNVLSTGAITGNAVAVYGTGTTNSVTNHGLIHSAGFAVYLVGVSNVVQNFGTISSRGDSAGFLGAGSKVVNYGTFTGYEGLGISWAETPSVTTIENHGTISGRDDGIDIGAASGQNTIIQNHGVISTSGLASGNFSITSGSSNDTVINHGVIHGNVSLGNGDDDLDLGTGTLRGDIDLGRGDDTLVISQVEEGARYEADGGEDMDILDMSAFDHAIWANFGYRGPEIWTRDGADVMSGNWRVLADMDNFEGVIGTHGVDFLAGNEADNYFGYLGDKKFEGNETILGFGGVDTADFSRFDSAVWINLESGTREVWTHDDESVVDGVGTWRSIVEMQGVENVVGTVGVDEMLGDANDNVFGYFGLFGDDAVVGTEVINGRNGTDTIDFSRADRAVWVDLTSGIEAWTQDDYNTTSGGGNWREIADLTSVENIVGTENHDLLRGDAGDNVIDGFRGFDDIHGRGGNDTFVFGSANGSIGGSAEIFDFSDNDAEKVDLSQVEDITDFADLAANHVFEASGILYIADSSGSIYLHGYSLADFGAGNIIDDDDFIF